jgi:hypothetical protein
MGFPMAPSRGNPWPSSSLNSVPGTLIRAAARRAPASDQQAERMRTRVRLLVQLTTRHGTYRRGLVQAAKSLTPQEAAVLADLEAHGLDVNQLRDVLWGGHVLVDDPDLYERWRFPKVTRERLSSHHRTVDKQAYPDLGMHGPLVREKLHGRTAAGTWVQLEKTPAAFGAGHRLPTWNDVQHLADYVVYKVTKRNVGPWGLSTATERRPMYLSPQLSTTVPLPEGTTRALTKTLYRLDAEDQVAQDVTGVQSDLVGRFLGPLREDPLAELVPGPGRGRGRGLFGNSQVWVTETARSTAHRLLSAEGKPGGWTLPKVLAARPIEVAVGDRRLRLAVRVPAGSEEAS